jgi:hypothetical protein
MGLHSVPDVIDHFSQAWMNKMPFLLDVFPRDEFYLLFWNLTLTCVFFLFWIVRLFALRPLLAYCAQPRVIAKMIVEKQMECRVAGETEVLRENLPQHHFCPSQNPT